MLKAGPLPGGEGNGWRTRPAAPARSGSAWLTPVRRRGVSRHRCEPERRGGGRLPAHRAATEGAMTNIRRVVRHLITQFLGVIVALAATAAWQGHRLLQADALIDHTDEVIEQ